jgi:hypothetical protein
VFPAAATRSPAPQARAQNSRQHPASAGARLGGIADRQFGFRRCPALRVSIGAEGAGCRQQFNAIGRTRHEKSNLKLESALLPIRAN